METLKNELWYREQKYWKICRVLVQMTRLGCFSIKNGSYKLKGCFCQHMIFFWKRWRDPENETYEIWMRKKWKHNSCLMRLCLENAKEICCKSKWISIWNISLSSWKISPFWNAMYNYLQLSLLFWNGNTVNNSMHMYSCLYKIAIQNLNKLNCLKIKPANFVLLVDKYYRF